MRNHSSDTNAWPGWANSLADEVIALRSALDSMRHELQQEKVRANNWEGVATDQEAALDSMREERDTFKRGVNENAALVDEQRERAEAAEAELARLREGLIAKATFWEENAGRFTHGADTVLRESAHALRVLATPPGYSAVRRPGEVHIGNPRGLIAVWLDEQDAHDMAAHYGHRDAFSGELIAAIDKAYPAAPPDTADDEAISREVAARDAADTGERLTIEELERQVLAPPDTAEER